MKHQDFEQEGTPEAGISQLRESLDEVAQSYGLQSSRGLTSRDTVKHMLDTSIDTRSGEKNIKSLINDLIHAAIHFLREDSGTSQSVLDTMDFLLQSVGLDVAGGRVINGPILNSIIAVNIQQSAKLYSALMNGEVARVFPDDGSDYEGEQEDYSNLSLKIKSQLGEKIIVRFDSQDHYTPEDEWPVRVFEYEDHKRVDLVTGYSDRYVMDGQPREVRLVDTVGYIYIPLTFIDKIGSDPLEALVEIIELSSKVKDLMLVQYDPDVSPERAQEHAASFLFKFLGKQSHYTYHQMGLSTRSINALLEYARHGFSHIRYSGKVFPKSARGN